LNNVPQVSSSALERKLIYLTPVNRSGAAQVHFRGEPERRASFTVRIVSDPTALTFTLNLVAGRIIFVRSGVFLELVGQWKANREMPFCGDATVARRMRQG